MEDAVSITRASGGAEREVLAAVDYGNLPQLPSPGTGFNHVARCGPGGRLALLGPAGETLIAAVDSQALRGEVAGLLATSGSDPAQPLRVDWQRVEVLSPDAPRRTGQG